MRFHLQHFLLKHYASKDVASVQKEVFIALPIQSEKVNQSCREIFLGRP